jgi:hypothetical protein
MKELSVETLVRDGIYQHFLFNINGYSTNTLHVLNFCCLIDFNLLISLPLLSTVLQLLFFGGEGDTEDPLGN